MLQTLFNLTSRQSLPGGCGEVPIIIILLSNEAAYTVPHSCTSMHAMPTSRYYTVHTYPYTTDSMSCNK